MSSPHECSAAQMAVKFMASRLISPQPWAACVTHLFISSAGEKALGSFVRHTAALWKVESNLVDEDVILLGQAAVLRETRLDQLHTFKLAPARGERRAQKAPALMLTPRCVRFLVWMHKLAQVQPRHPLQRDDVQQSHRGTKQVRAPEPGV